MFAVHAPQLIPGNPAATAAASLAAADTYRLALTLDLVSTAAYAGVTVIFYLLLKPANRFVAAVAAGFGLIGLVVGLTNTAAHYAPLVVMTNAGAFGVFSLAQLQALVFAFIKIQSLALTIAMIFFGLQCFCNGTVVVRSGYFPWLLGVLLMLTGIAYLTSTIGGIWSPALVKAIFPVVMMAGFGGEGAMTLWLIIVGVHREKWEAAA
jgi:hypothetical protein